MITFAPPAAPSADGQDSLTRAGFIGLIGRPNVGKSTLLNVLTEAGVLVEDRLFATLDATTRRLELPGGEMVFLTDTVGFVRKLPHQLVEAFTTTLDVVIDADLLVHVVDGSAVDPPAEIAAVHEVLADIGAGDGSFAVELAEVVDQEAVGLGLDDDHAGSLDGHVVSVVGRRLAASSTQGVDLGAGSSCPLEHLDTVIKRLADREPLAIG